MRTMVPAGALLYEAKKEKKSQVETVFGAVTV